MAQNRMMKKDCVPKGGEVPVCGDYSGDGPEGAKREYDVIFGALFHIYQDPDAWNALKAKASDITWTIERIADNRSADGRLTPVE
ncbi:MAG: hypothetical protein ACLUAR_03215 [Pilosibacter sp.]